MSYMSAYLKERYAAHKAQGKCIYCDDATEPNNVHCVKHAIAKAIFGRKYYAQAHPCRRVFHCGICDSTEHTARTHERACKSTLALVP